MFGNSALTKGNENKGEKLTLVLLLVIGIIKRQERKKVTQRGVGNEWIRPQRNIDKSPDLFLVHFSDFSRDVSREDQVGSERFSPDTSFAFIVEGSDVAVADVVVVADVVAVDIVVVADDVVVDADVVVADDVVFGQAVALDSVSRAPEALWYLIEHTLPG